MEMQVYSSWGSVTAAGGLQDRTWLQHTLAVLQPLTTSQGQLYNYFNCVQDPWETYFGSQADRLQQIKAKYDPDGLLGGLHCQCGVV